MGPIQATGNGSDASSSTSSIRELSAMDEKGLSRSFKAIQGWESLVEEGTSDSDNDNENKSTEKVDQERTTVMSPEKSYEWRGTGLKTEPLKVLEDETNRASPESTTSSHSDQRIIVKQNGGQIKFAPGNIQEKHNLAKTTRDFLRQEQQLPVPNNAHVFAAVNGISEQTSVKTPISTRTSVESVNTPISTQTHVKTVVPSVYEEMTQEREFDMYPGNLEKHGVYCWTKCVLLSVCVLMLLTGIVLLIHYYRPSKNSGTRGKVIADPIDSEINNEDCPVARIKFKDQILFSCSFLEQTAKKLASASSVLIRPPPLYNDGNNITISPLDTTSGGWNLSFSENKLFLNGSGPPSTCSSSGNYSLIFRDQSNTTLHSVPLTINVISEVSKVNVTLAQEKSYDGDKQYRIECSTNSGCQQSSLDFVTEEQTYLRGVNFVCQFRYSDSDGYSVSCDGVVPDSLKEDFKKITCRPNSPLLDDKNSTAVKELEEEVELPNVTKTSVCPGVRIKFKEPILIRCQFPATTANEIENATSVMIFPPPYYNSGNNITVPFEETTLQTSSDWQIQQSEDGFNVTGPNATCSSSGGYRLEFRGRNDTIEFSVSLTIDVISEVSKVNVTLIQEQSVNGDKQFKVGCSTNSGCQQAFVDFFAEINKNETSLRGVDFLCKIGYNDQDGYNVSCEGIVPDFLMEQFEKITCRPHSVLLDNKDEKERQELEEEVELPDCDIANNCGYKCKSYSSHYYVVDENRCDIFHICYNNIAYSGFCPPGTFFNPGLCGCDHSKTIDWCRDDGFNQGENEIWCDASKPKDGSTEKPTAQSAMNS